MILGAQSGIHAHVEKTMDKTYLGDSVYVADTGYGIVLTTENG